MQRLLTPDRGGRAGLPAPAIRTCRAPRARAQGVSAGGPPTGGDAHATFRDTVLGATVLECSGRNERARCVDLRPVGGRRLNGVVARRIHSAQFGLTLAPHEMAASGDSSSDK